MKQVKIKTRRLLLSSRNLGEMQALAANETNEEMKIAYGEMIESMHRCPENEVWACDFSISFNGTVIGGIGFKGKPNEWGYVEIGYGIDEGYRQRGFASEAVAALCRWALRQKGVRGVLAQTEEDNEISKKVLRRNGFRPFGMGNEGPQFLRGKSSHSRGVERYIAANFSSLAGKTIAISGASGGLGTELSLMLGEERANLVILDRNMEKAGALIRRLHALFGGMKITHLPLDLCDLPKVKETAAALEKMGVDGLILNAGAYAIPHKKLDSGYDNVFQINFLSPYCLAKRLFPSIKARGGRIVAVGSIAHTYGHLDTNDVDYAARQNNAGLVYGNAKRFLMFSLYSLFDGDETLALSHPGISFTGITDHYPKWLFFFIKYPMKVIFMKPEKACLSIMKGLYLPCKKNEWIGPRFFSVWGLPKKSVLKTCKKEEADAIASVTGRIVKELDL